MMVPRSDFQTGEKDRAGPQKAGRRPFARLACVPGQQARGCRGPSRRAATHRPSSSDGTWGWPVPEVPARLFTVALALRWSGAEPPVTRRVRAQGAQEIDPPEGRPVGVAEVELRVGALPQQEPAQPLLPRGPDHQVGIGRARRGHLVAVVYRVASPYRKDQPDPDLVIKIGRAHV